MCVFSCVCDSLCIGAGYRQLGDRYWSLFWQWTRSLHNWTNVWDQFVFSSNLNLPRFQWWHEWRCSLSNLFSHSILFLWMTWMQLIDTDILVPIIDGDSIRDSLTFFIPPLPFVLALMLWHDGFLKPNSSVKSEVSVKLSDDSDAKTEKRQHDVSHKISRYLPPRDRRTHSSAAHSRLTTPTTVHAHIRVAI